MSSSFERILTTHTGSLARPPKLAAMLKTIAARKPVALDLFEAECLAAVNDVVRKQCEVGLDIINDGEMSKTGFAPNANWALAARPRQENPAARQRPKLPDFCRIALRLFQPDGPRFYIIPGKNNLRCL